MTSKTARANAKIKREEKAAHDALYEKWKILLEQERAARSDFLALGGSELELTAFFYQYATA